MLAVQRWSGAELGPHRLPALRNHVVWDQRPVCQVCRRNNSKCRQDLLHIVPPGPCWDGGCVLHVRRWNDADRFPDIMHAVRNWQGRKARALLHVRSWN